MDNLDSQIGSNLRREIIMTRLICLTFQKSETTRLVSNILKGPNSDEVLVIA